MSTARHIAAAQFRRVDSAFRAATASMRALPDFLIIGESKCGTTSLYDDIVGHPSVLSAAVKEPHFFSTRYQRGLNWYRAQFPVEWRMRRGSGTDRIQTGEASPYYLSHPHAAHRIKSILPGVKAIAMLRNPIDRAYSQYQHEFRKNRETLSFEEAIAREPERLKGELERMIRDENYNSPEYRRHSYVTRGIYVDHLRTWLTHFDRAQLLIIKSEAYFAAPEKTLSEVLAFLELPLHQPRRYAKRNVGRYAPIPADLRQRLVDYFAPHNAKLYELVGVDYGWQ
jgi:hypothetical protein